jgi:hypothetical protein
MTDFVTQQRAKPASKNMPVSRARYDFVALDVSPLVSAVMSCFGEETEREKSMIYLTGLSQKMQGVSWISCTRRR